MDTTAGELEVDLYLRLKQTGDSSMYQVYFLDDSWVFPDYSLEQKGAIDESMDTISYHLLNIVQKEKVLRPTVLNRLVWQDSVSVFLKKNSNRRSTDCSIWAFINSSISVLKKRRKMILYSSTALFISRRGKCGM